MKCEVDSMTGIEKSIGSTEPEMAAINASASRGLKIVRHISLPFGPVGPVFVMAVNAFHVGKSWPQAIVS